MESYRGESAAMERIACSEAASNCTEKVKELALEVLHVDGPVKMWALMGPSGELLRLPSPALITTAFLI